jgi:hypothetical protein
MARLQPKTDTALQLVPIAVDVDLVRIEKNLLQIGFFGANDARDKGRSSRRIEQVVFRNGHKIRVAAEFRGSEQLGLPSTTDRDKFIALLKIVSEERARQGRIENPIRFSGYRMIQELGLSRNGEIYEEILRWGKRMTDTTITSEQVVYFAAKKVYSDEVLHVFRSFKRTGSSKLNGSEKQEHYEVVLEDWLLENLNQRYVIPEDFNAYKALTRPTAKGIFGNLHLWFHASQGRQVEKDYAELCNLLNVQVYPHLSKIRSTMGLALDELVKIKYISRWDVQPMSSKQGYKIVLTPGAELLNILQNQRAERTERRDPEVKQPVSELAEAALEVLLRHGVLPAKAKSLVERFKAEVVLDTVDYLEAQMQHGKRNAVENPAGLIIYSIENALPLPAGFVSARRRKALQQTAERTRASAEARLEAEQAYSAWLDARKRAALAEQYPEAELQARLERIVLEQSRADEAFRQVPARNRMGLAMQIALREVGETLDLPAFEVWLAENRQVGLF